MNLSAFSGRNLLISSCCVGLMSALAGKGSAAVVGYNTGHGDLGIAYEGGELELHYHFEDGLNESGPEVEYAPDEVLVRAPDASMVTTTEGLPFLGTSSGDMIWVLPEGEEAGVPFFGIGTDELDPLEVSSLELSLTGFSGPGQFALWQDGFPSPTVFMQTVDGLSAGDTVDPGVGGHGHYNWGFTAEGVYSLEMTATAQLVGGGTATDTATFSFAVGSSTVPEPSVALLGAVGGMFLLRRRRS